MSSYGALAGSPSLGALAHGPRLPPGLVHAWTLDNTASGYVDFARGLTLTQQGTGTSTAAGIVGDAASFDGNGNLITGNIALLQPGFAAECWLYSNTLAGYSVAMAQYQEIVGSDVFVFLLDRNVASLRFIIYNTSNVGVTATATIAATTWYHAVLCTTPDQRVRGYVNGSLVSTSSVLAGTLITSALPLYIGNRGGTAYRWNGRIDEPRIWQFGAAGDPGAAFWLARYNNGLGRRP